MPARIHPGRVVHVWDHYVITLRDHAGGEHLLSLYDIGHSPGLGSGRVGIVRRPGTPTRLYADTAAVGSAMSRRLIDMAGDDDDLPAGPEIATFERQARTDGIGWRVEGATSSVEGRWERTGDAFWAEGPAPAFWDEEDIWACFVEAAEASIILDGSRIGGDVFSQDTWVSKVGRSLSSAHIAFAETRITPAPDGWARVS